MKYLFMLLFLTGCVSESWHEEYGYSPDEILVSQPSDPKEDLEYEFDEMNGLPHRQLAISDDEFGGGIVPEEEVVQTAAPVVPAKPIIKKKAHRAKNKKKRLAKAN